MKKYLLSIAFFLVLCLNINAQIGLGFGNLKLPLQYKSNPKHRYGITARLTVAPSGGASLDTYTDINTPNSNFPTIKKWSLYPQLNVIRRFHFTDEYNYYLGVGISRYFFKDAKINQDENVVYHPFIFGFEAKPFKNKQQYLVAFEIGIRTFNNQSFNGGFVAKGLLPYANVDITYFFEKKIKDKKVKKS